MAGILQVAAAAVITLVLVIAVGYLASAYNALLKLAERCERAERDVDVSLKRRQDALTTLVDVVREDLDGEEALRSRLVEARAGVERATSPRELARADARVREAVGAFAARAEAGYEPGSVATARRLLEEVAELGDEIADRRAFYNDSVALYNARIRQLPFMAFAGAVGYTRRELFEASDEDVADVDVGAVLSRDVAAGDGPEPSPDA